MSSTGFDMKNCTNKPKKACQYSFFTLQPLGLRVNKKSKSFAIFICVYVSVYIIKKNMFINSKTRLLQVSV